MINYKNFNKLSFDEKIKYSNNVIQEWYENYEGRVFVAYSGGVKSEVLLHMVRKLYPDVLAVHVNNGLDNPEIYKKVKHMKNVEIIEPSITPEEMFKNFGYQVISRELSIYASVGKNGSEKAQNCLKGIMYNGKQNLFIKKDFSFLLDAPFKIHIYCCHKMITKPLTEYSKKYNTQMIYGRTSNRPFKMSGDKHYNKNFLNRYNLNLPHKSVSYPLYFWRVDDFREYIDKYNVKINASSSFQGKIDHYNSKGRCLLCLCNLDKVEQENKFKFIRENYPKLFYTAIERYGYREVLDFLGYNYK